MFHQQKVQKSSIKTNLKFPLFSSTKSTISSPTLNSKNMSKWCVTKNVWDQTKNKNTNTEEKTTNQNSLSKHLMKIYPLGNIFCKSNSSLSSTMSLTLSQSSNDSCLTDSFPMFHRKLLPISHRIAPPVRKRDVIMGDKSLVQPFSSIDLDGGDMKRCNWITKNSDKVYVKFHDECWGVPIYEDKKLFELLAMSGMLMDYNWTEILKRKDLLSESFGAFDANIVAKMGEKEIMEIASNKELMLAESRVRCIVDNSKCILKIVKEWGSFSNYMWSSINYKPIINRYKHPRNVPLRTPKAEAMSKDLIKRGFRLVGPVIMCSWMQATGMTIDHLVDCFRFDECVSLAERPWRHV